MRLSEPMSSMAVERSDLTQPGTKPAFDPRHIISLATPTVVAFIGRTQRGPLNQPVTITSLEAYRRVFGQATPFSFVAQSVAQFFQSGGQLAVVVRVANRATRGSVAVPAGPEALLLQALQPGSHEVLRVSVDYDGIGSAPDRFNLVVQRLSRPGSELVEDQEFFQGVSMAEDDERFVVDALQDSELVRLSGPLPRVRPDATRARHPGQPIPYLDMTLRGSDGEDLSDYDLIGSQAEGTGLFALDRIESIDLLCIPPAPGRELGSTTFLAAERYCDRRRALFIWDPPAAWTSADAALIGIRQAAQTSVNALTYFPRLRGRDDRGGAAQPACGVVAGMLAKADSDGRRRAAQRASVRLLGVQPAVAVDTRSMRRLNRHGVNVFALEGDGGYGLVGNATLSGPHSLSSAAQQLDRRRLSLYIASRIERCADCWHEASPAAAQALQQQLEGFLRRLFEAGAFAASAAEQAYFVNVPAGRGGAVLSLGFALDRPAVFSRYELEPRGTGWALRAVAAHDAAQLAG